MYGFYLVELLLSSWYVICIKASNAHITECNPIKDPIFKLLRHLASFIEKHTLQMAAQASLEYSTACYKS